MMKSMFTFMSNSPLFSQERAFSISSTSKSLKSYDLKSLLAIGRAADISNLVGSQIISS